jgi:hypothetical protein
MEDADDDDDGCGWPRLDFTDEEWESLKALREADEAATMTTTVDDIIGALGMENEMIEGTINEGAV